MPLGIKLRFIKDAHADVIHSNAGQEDGTASWMARYTSQVVDC